MTDDFDDTESVRRMMLEHGIPQRDLAEAKQKWDHIEVARDFEIVGFMAPFCVAIRKSDGKKGSLEFTHHPRFYFNFVED
jgi:hypothetical protein